MIEYIICNMAEVEMRVVFTNHVPINTDNSGDNTMKVFEVIGTQAMQPTAAAQQARINKVVQQRIASQAQLPATELDKVLAMRQAADLQKRTDKAYAKRLRQQLANAQTQLR